MSVIASKRIYKNFGESVFLDNEGDFEPDLNDLKEHLGGRINKILGAIK